MAIELTEQQRQKLKAEREKRSLLPAALAGQLGVSRPMVVQLESGVKKPSAELLDRWAELLGFSVVNRGVELKRKAGVKKT